MAVAAMAAGGAAARVGARAAVKGAARVVVAAAAAASAAVRASASVTAVAARGPAAKHPFLTRLPVVPRSYPGCSGRRAHPGLHP